jgi:hypothetical protein
MVNGKKTYSSDRRYEHREVSQAPSKAWLAGWSSSKDEPAPLPLKGMSFVYNRKS